VLSFELADIHARFSRTIVQPVPIRTVQQCTTEQYALQEGAARQLHNSHASASGRECQRGPVASSCCSHMKATPVAPPCSTKMDASPGSVSSLAQSRCHFTGERQPRNWQDSSLHHAPHGHVVRFRRHAARRIRYHVNLIAFALRPDSRHGKAQC
jgi:hypothetical protein